MKPVRYIADHLRQVLINGASAPHTEEVQHFFKEVITSRGWYTDEIRKLAKRFSRVIANDAGIDYLFAICDDLFHGKVLEEKVLAVFMLQYHLEELTDKHFRGLVRWLDRVSTWADHDALVSYLLGPMLVEKRERAALTAKWAKSRDRWHRRAAAVSLIRGVRQKRFVREAKTVTLMLLSDKDEMVLKGVSWLLREQAKYDVENAMPLLRSIRARAPRLILRTACETLHPGLRTEILGNPRPKRLRLSQAAD